MKAIKILDTDEKSGHLALTNCMGYEIDKDDHVLRIHRMFDGDSVFDNIQLENGSIYNSADWAAAIPYHEKVEELIEEFLADDDAYILDISEYVDQEVMKRGDEEEWVCSNCGKAANRCRIRTQATGIFALMKGGPLWSARIEALASYGRGEEEEDDRDDCMAPYSIKKACPDFDDSKCCEDGKCKRRGHCYGKEK